MTTPIGPKDEAWFLTPRQEKTIQNSLFAIALIVSIGALLVGFLGTYQVSFFNSIPNQVAQTLIYGGGALLLASLVLKAIAYCCRNESQTNTPTPTPPVGMPQNNIPEPVKPQPPQPTGNPTPSTPTPAQPQPPVRPAIPVLVLSDWQPLANLQTRRSQQVKWVPASNADTYDLLEEVKTIMPSPGPLNPRAKPQIEKDLFVQKMKSVYVGLLEGKVTVVAQNLNHDLSAKDPMPLNKLALAQVFVRSQIEAFNTHNPSFSIDYDQLFQECAMDAEIHTPENLFRAYLGLFIVKLAQDLSTLFSIENSFPHCAKIIRYGKDQVAIFNAQMGFFSPSVGMEFQPHDFEPIQHIIAPFRLAEIGKELERVIAFEGDIDSKILMLSEVAQAFPNKEDPIWTSAGNSKNKILIAFSQLGTDFFSHYQFIVTKEADQDRKTQVESAIELMAQKLGTQAPEIKVVMDTSNDAALAAAQQREEQDRATQRLLAALGHH